MGFVIKQHWRLWFYYAKILSEVKGPSWRSFHILRNWTKMRKASQLSVTLHNLPCASKGCGKISADGERSECPWPSNQTQSSDSSPRLCPTAAKPASHGWGPVCHLLRWLCSGCAAVRLVSQQLFHCKMKANIFIFHPLMYNISSIIVNKSRLKLVSVAGMRKKIKFRGFPCLLF